MNPRRIGPIVFLLILSPIVSRRPALAQEARGGFEEFRIEINSEGEAVREGSKKPPEWHVRILSCPIDEFNDRSTRIRPSFTIQQLNFLRRRQGQDPDLGQLRTIGDAVRKSILDEKLEPALVASVALARSQGKGLRLVFVLKQEKVAEDSISPAELPVEAIRFPQILTLTDFPATGRNFTVSRSLGQPTVAPREVIYPVRMLVVAAAPIDQNDVKAEESLSAIRAALNGLAFDAAGQPLANGPVRVDLLRPTDQGPVPATPTRRRALAYRPFRRPWRVPTRRRRPDAARPTSCSSGRPVGKATPSGPTSSASLSTRPGLRLVVLTACSSAAAQPKDPGKSKYPANAFDGVAHHLLRATEVSAVVAMQFDYEVAAAKVFAREFYKSLLADQQDIDVAVSRCRQELATQFDLGSGVWITPALYSRSRNGRVFEIRERLGLGGSVIDADTLRPLPGVKLIIDDIDDLFGKTPTAVTDEAGRFRFPDLPPLPERQVRLVAQRPGYQVSRTDPTLGNMSHAIKLYPEP